MCVGGIIGKGIGMDIPIHAREGSYDKGSRLKIQERPKEYPGEIRNSYFRGIIYRRRHESREVDYKRSHEVIP